MSLADKIDAAIQARMLLDACAGFIKDHEFVVGQLVQLKPATASRFRFPGKDCPLIIVGHIDPPIAGTNGHSYGNGFGEKMNVHAMTLDDDGDIATFAFNSRYLEPYTGKIGD